MDDKKRAEIMAIIEHFGEETPSSKLIEEFATKNGYEPITASQYEDWVFQIEYDKKVVAFLAEATKLITQVRYTPELASREEKDKIAEINEDLTIEIAKLIEKYEFSYHVINGLGSDIGRLVAGLFESAGS